MSNRKRNGAGAAERKLEECMRELHDTPVTFEEMQEIRKFMRSQSNLWAIHQLLRASPKVNPELSDDDRMLCLSAFYQSFFPSDGTELALSRLATISTEHAMDCFERAANADHPVRAIELNLAIRLSLTSATLNKTLDNHRGRNWPEFIHEPVSRSANLPSKANGVGEPEPDGSPKASSEARSAAKDEPKQ